MVYYIMNNVNPVEIGFDSPSADYITVLSSSDRAIPDSPLGQVYRGQVQCCPPRVSGSQYLLS